MFKYQYNFLTLLMLIPWVGLNFTLPGQESQGSLYFSAEGTPKWPLVVIQPIFKIGHTLTPPFIRDLYKFFINVPAHKLENPTNMTHASTEQTYSYLQNAVLPYCPNYDLFNFKCFCKDSYIDISVFEDENFDSLVLVAADLKRKKIVVSYRATLTPLNWKQNFDYQLVDIPTAPHGVRVHHGFYSYFLSSYHNTRRAVSKLLEKPEYKDFDLLVSGYSLGAAVAIISTHDWYSLLKAKNYHHRLEVVSYSGPRVGNAEFANYLASLNVSITRYTLQNDLVSDLPPRSLGYVHAGVELYQSNYPKKEFRVCRQDFDEDPECSLKDRTSLSVVPHVTPFNTHAPFPPYC